MGDPRPRAAGAAAPLQPGGIWACVYLEERRSEVEAAGTSERQRDRHADECVGDLQAA